jgi:hypothetical protein
MLVAKINDKKILLIENEDNMLFFVVRNKENTNTVLVGVHNYYDVDHALMNFSDIQFQLDNNKFNGSLNVELFFDQTKYYV